MDLWTRDSKGLDHTPWAWLVREAGKTLVRFNSGESTTRFRNESEARAYLRTAGWTLWIKE